MKDFVSIYEDQLIEFAFVNASYFRNKAREAKWGVPVYFAPSTNGYDVLGTAGSNYVYGKPCKIGQGYNGNCTWWCIARYHMVSGIVLKECIGDAQYFLKKYKGRKSDNGYVGDKIQKGDILVYGDSDAGHVNFVEDVKGNTLYISESAYSKKEIYKGKACITYTLDKTKMVVGNKISLRPQVPYTEKLLGVIHTGDVFDKDSTLQELKQENKTLKDKLAKIKELCG